MEGLRCTKGNLPFKRDGLACSGEEIYHFCFVFSLYSRANSKYKPPGCAYIWRGDLTGGFLCYDFGGGGGGALIIWRGLIIFGIYGMFIN